MQPMKLGETIASLGDKVNPIGEPKLNSQSSLAAPGIFILLLGQVVERSEIIAPTAAHKDAPSAAHGKDIIEIQG